MNSTRLKINSLAYSIFSILFVFYFAYINSFLLSSIFVIYAILFVSMYILSLKNIDRLVFKFKEYNKHYLLSIGFMLTWLIIYIIDIKSLFSAFDHLQYILLGATTFVVSSLYYKLIVKQ